MKEEERLRDLRRVRRRNRKGNVFARPTELRGNAETAMSCRDLDLPERRKSCRTSSRGEKEEDEQMCRCGKAVPGR